MSERTLVLHKARIVSSSSDHCRRRTRSDQAIFRVLHGFDPTTKRSANSYEEKEIPQQGITSESADPKHRVSSTFQAVVAACGVTAEGRPYRMRPTGLPGGSRRNARLMK